MDRPLFHAARAGRFNESNSSGARGLNPRLHRHWQRLSVLPVPDVDRALGAGSNRQGRPDDHRNRQDQDIQRTRDVLRVSRNGRRHSGERAGPAKGKGGLGKGTGEKKQEGGISANSTKWRYFSAVRDPADEPRRDRCPARAWRAAAGREMSSAQALIHAHRRAAMVRS
jgi:hypothetical protein